MPDVFLRYFFYFVLDVNHYRRVRLPVMSHAAFIMSGFAFSIQLQVPVDLLHQFTRCDVAVMAEYNPALPVKEYLHGDHDQAKIPAQFKSFPFSDDDAFNIELPGIPGLNFFKHFFHLPARTAIPGAKFDQGPAGLNSDCRKIILLIILPGAGWVVAGC